MHQTPMEYMHAVLDEGPGLPERALLDLTGLFEVAKFSTHKVGKLERDHALALLKEIHGQLVAQLEQGAA